MSRPVESQATARWSGAVWLLLAGAAGYLYCNLFLLPGTPILQSDDQVYFWMNAQRMLSGQHAYIDFFQLTPPGTDLFFLALFKSFGPQIWVVNAAVIFLGVALCWVCFQVALHILESRLAVLAALLYLVAIFGKPLNATHHWFSALSLMGAVAVVLPKRTGNRLAIAGALLALATFFTHTHGIAALVAFAVFLLWEHIDQENPTPELFRRLALLGLSFIAYVIAFNSYFVATAGLGLVWYEQVTYVRSFSVLGFSTPNLGLPARFAWHNFAAIIQQVIVYALLPIVYALTLFTIKPNAAAPTEKQRVALLSLVGLFLLVEVAFSPNWLRIYGIAMPGIILAVWTINKLSSIRRYSIPLVAIAIAGLAIIQLWTRQHRLYVTLQLPAGTTAVPAAQFEELDWLAKHTKPGDFIFQAGWPGLYIPLALRNPLFLDVVGTSDQTRPEQIDLTISQLDQSPVRYILWSQRLDVVPPGHPEQYHLEPLRQYLRERYTLTKTFAETADEVWQRKASESR